MTKTSLFLYESEKTLRQEFGMIAGVDEAGRGPLAGPLVVAACILDLDRTIPLLDDSKKLSGKKREVLFDKILSVAKDYRIVVMPVSEIDSLNILGATMTGMERAVKTLSLKPDLVLIDGNRRPAGLPEARTVVKGDAKYASIAAASILAKVTRDRIMDDLSRKYPVYNFQQNKGYPTKEHLNALITHGITEHHRRSFRPVAEREKIIYNL